MLELRIAITCPLCFMFLKYLLSNFFLKQNNKMDLTFCKSILCTIMLIKLFFQVKTITEWNIGNIWNIKTKDDMFILNWLHFPVYCSHNLQYVYIFCKILKFCCIWIVELMLCYVYFISNNTTETCELVSY